MRTTNCVNIKPDYTGTSVGKSPLILIAPFRRVRAAQLLLVFFVVVRPIRRRDVAERQPVSLAAVTVAVLRDASPRATMAVRGRVAVGPRVVLRRGRPPGRQRCAGRERFRAQQVLQLVVGLFAPHRGHLSRGREQIKKTRYIFFCDSAFAAYRRIASSLL